MNLTYPQNGIIPSVELVLPSSRDIGYSLQTSIRMFEFTNRMQAKLHLALSSDAGKRSLQRRQVQSGRDLSQRVNGSIDPWVNMYFWSAYHGVLIRIVRVSALRRIHRLRVEFHVSLE